MSLATPADAHREWHRNTGRCCGCPQDACDSSECPNCSLESIEDKIVVAKQELNIREDLVQEALDVLYERMVDRDFARHHLQQLRREEVGY